MANRVEQAIRDYMAVRVCGAVIGFYNDDQYGLIVNEIVETLYQATKDEMSAAIEGPIRASVKCLVVPQKIDENTYALPPGNYGPLFVSGNNPIIWRLDEDPDQPEGTKGVVKWVPEYLDRNRVYRYKFGEFPMKDGEKMTILITNDTKMSRTAEGYLATSNKPGVGVVPSQMQRITFVFTSSYSL